MSPDTMRTYAVELDRIAAELELALTGTLSRNATAWEGPAADRLGDEAADRRARLFAAADRLGWIAAAVREEATALEEQAAATSATVA